MTTRISDGSSFLFLNRSPRNHTHPIITLVGAFKVTGDVFLFLATSCIPPLKLDMPPKSAKRARVPTIRKSTYRPKPTTVSPSENSTTQSWITTVEKPRNGRNTMSFDNTKVVRAGTPSASTDSNDLPETDTRNSKPGVPEANVKKRKRVYTAKVCFSRVYAVRIFHIFSVYY